MTLCITTRAAVHDSQSVSDTGISQIFTKVINILVLIAPQVVQYLVIIEHTTTACYHYCLPACSMDDPDYICYCLPLPVTALLLPACLLHG